MRRVVIGSLTMTAILGLIAHPTAAAQPTQPAKETPKPKPAPAPEPTEVKSFTVEHFTPTELSAVVAQVWGKLPRKAGEPAKAMPKIAVTDRTKTLIAIGTKAELETLAAVLAAVDGDPAKSADGAPVFLVKLKHAQVAEAVAALGSLELGDHVVPVQKTKVLVIVPPTAACGTQVRQVLELLDKESTTKTPSK